MTTRKEAIPRCDHRRPEIQVKKGRNGCCAEVVISTFCGLKEIFVTHSDCLECTDHESSRSNKRDEEGGNS